MKTRTIRELEFYTFRNELCRQKINIYDSNLNFALRKNKILKARNVI